MINLYFLKYFYDAFHEKSLTKASRLNYVSVPAISNAITKLEEYYDCTLLKHKKNELQFTQEAIKLAKEAKCLIEHALEIDEKMNLDSQIPMGKIHFATSHSLGSFIMPKLLKDLKKSIDLNLLQFRLIDPLTIETWLERKFIDFGLTLLRERHKRYKKDVLFQGQFIFIANKNSDISNQSYLLSNLHEESQDILKQYYKKNKSPLPIEMVSHSWEIICKLVLQGIGIGFIPDYLYHFHDNKNQLKIVETDLILPQYKLVLLFSDEFSINENATFKQFKEKLMKNFKKIH